MTDDTPAAVRVMTDGGDPETVTRTVEAKDVVTREVDGDEVEMLRVPISSTRPDREGDRFAKQALEGMADQIREEQPMVFDNHGLAGDFMGAIPYDSRETIGAQMDAEVEQADDGEYELYAMVNPDGTHPEGERMVKQVADEKQPIKFSVGFRVLGYDEIQDDAGNEVGREFTEVDEMETSRVGIPANPDASTPQQMSAKGAGAGMMDLPGYQKHPIMQMLMANADAGSGAAETKGAGGTAPDAERDKVEGGCDADADCPEGEVCVEGECIPEDELDGGDPGDTKAFEDVEMGEFDEFVAAHQEGADASEVGDALDTVGEWVGGLDRAETAALVASATGATTGDVQDAFDDLMGDDDGDGGGEEGDTEEESAGTTPEAEAEAGEEPEHVREMREEMEELRAEVQSYREAATERGDPKTGVTEGRDAAAEYPEAEADAEETAEGAGKPLTEQLR
jgi:hypothetical protein